MTLEELIEEHLAGGQPKVPEDLVEDFRKALVGDVAMRDAVNDTAAWPNIGSADRPPPELPADYEIVRELGRGGMGVVYLVRQKSLGRLVAVKVLRPGEATLGRVVQRFLEEARHLARLRHANIVGVHEVGQAGGEPYFTMDYVEGESLSAVLARGRMSPTQAIALWKQVAQGIEHAHAQGIIHRDLKPGNVLIDTAGRAYVTDFGLARDMAQMSVLSNTGEMMGTPAYMAPEQAQGQSALIGETTDVHALGALLYEMLTGRPPYGKDSPAAVLARVIRDEPCPPRRIDRRIPRDLETICLKALAKEPAKRYATVRAFQEDIRRYETGISISARRPSWWGRGVRLLRRKWKIAAMLTATILLVAFLSAQWFGPGRNQLIAAGDERHAAGKYAEAAQLYRRAANRSWFSGPALELERLIHTYRAGDDTDGALAAAIEFLDYDPDAWFGDLDYAVAQAALNRRRPVKANLAINILRDIPPDELAIKRLQIFLNEPYGTETQRTSAEQTLVELRAAMGTVPAGFAGVPEPPTILPTQPPEELLRQAGDPKESPSVRAGAAAGAGMVLEKRGDRAAALAAYRKAYELFRPHFPVYAGLVNGITMARPRSHFQEPIECSYLRHVVLALRRLDPEFQNPLRGGVRFRIVGIDLPPDITIELFVSFCNPEDDAIRTNGGMVFDLNQTAWIGVADGRYRLRMDGKGGGGVQSSEFGARAAFLSQHMELDYAALNGTIVEVRGNTVEAPPIRARLRE